MKGVLDKMAKIKNSELTRVSINLPLNIVEKVKSYADSLGINTTSAYIVLLNQALEQKDMMNNLPIMFSMFNEIKSLNNIKQPNNTEM
jgi:hypothetical protein